jgi:outer membrane receptor for ferrienterochelin and colicins
MKDLIKVPTFYGNVQTNYAVNKRVELRMSISYTGSMIVPHVTGIKRFGLQSAGNLSQYTELIQTPSFVEANVSISLKSKLSDHYALTTDVGVINMFDQFQNDFDTGQYRDASYIYGPLRPRTFSIRLVIKHDH